ncbi:DUF3530 family protein [Colwellia sp. MB02u-10]|uniref:DUF3530 family protein n=1 Tax=Colwellia sp. MB02u-10 TaxID=2759828 RepID=UPI0015F388C1|nr:DUF3530 family protein [Colwellia sp. MB02u-10]MBA6342321.1 DUF3530 family protein [Colwellia sp. MB02u-10]
MCLNIRPIFLFIALTTLSLLVNSAHSWAMETAPPEKQTDNTSSTTPKSTEAETETSTAPTKSTEDSQPNKVMINAPVDAFEQQQQDIKHYLAQEKIMPLLVGTDSYLTVINEHTTAINKGVMVLIPDWQQSIATPNALNQLSNNMPQHGWTTITLHPPHKPQSYPSQAFTAQERSTEDIETLTNYEKKFAEVMQAVITKAKSYPGVIIVVVEGNHSAVLLNIYQQALVAAPSALVMLSSYMPTLPENDKIAQQLALSDYPILDLYLQRDHRLVLASAKMRKDFAQRAMKIYYRQRQLSNQATGYYPKQTLTKAIISWLSAMGW